MNRLKCEYIYWKGFNLFVRIMGALWLIGGSVALFQSFKFIPSTNMILVNKSPTTDPVMKIIAIFACLLVALFGLLMLKVKAYYPKRIQEWIKANTA